MSLTVAEQPWCPPLLPRWRRPRVSPLRRRAGDPGVIAAVLIEVGAERTLRRILVATARQCDVRVSLILSSSRFDDVVHARHLAMTLTRVLMPRCTLHRIGDWYGVHHTTVLYAERRYRELVTSCVQPPP